MQWHMWVMTYTLQTVFNTLIPWSRSVFIDWSVNVLWLYTHDCDWNRSATYQPLFVYGSEIWLVTSTLEKDNWHNGQLMPQTYHPYSLDRFRLQWRGLVSYRICQILSVDGTCVSFVTSVVLTPVKTIPELSRPAYRVRPKTSNTKRADAGKPDLERSWTICTRSISALWWQGDAPKIDRGGIYQWRRRRLLVMLHGERKNDTNHSRCYRRHWEYDYDSGTNSQQTWHLSSTC